MFRSKSGCQLKILSNCEKFDVNFSFAQTRVSSIVLFILALVDPCDRNDLACRFLVQIMSAFLEALLSNFQNTMWPENLDGSLIEYIFIDVAR